MPKLVQKFTVIAPDLPGIGDSDIPKDGSDMKTAAIRIHALVKSLGISKARVVGHDIGLMVAYAYAAQFPTEVEKLVVKDAFLPGVAGWELAYDNPIFGTSALTVRRQKRWSQDGRRSISRTSGTTSRRTKRGRFLWQTAKPTLQPIPVQDACVQAGPILLPGQTPPGTSPNLLKRN
jgi:pimeloyl-ACP methyl ester carboxylesterase